tara:strand:+ start:891 stop:1880 length:990 start_codon:yes stop_codon:yes gene_type:complete
MSEGRSTRRKQNSNRTHTEYSTLNDNEQQVNNNEQQVNNNEQQVNNNEQQVNNNEQQVNNKEVLTTDDEAEELLEETTGIQDNTMESLLDSIVDTDDDDNGNEEAEADSSCASSADSTEFEEEDDTEWPASTVMYIPGVIDDKLMQYFQKYLFKDSNKDRIFKPSMTILVDDEDIDSPEEPDEYEEIVDETFRKCKVAKDTHTLQKLYNMMEDNIDQAADKFIEKFNFFSIVSTKEEYTMLRFEPGDFYKEHIECSSLNDDTDGSSRRICVYLILEAPKQGGVFEFLYQGIKIVPEAGSIIMFPSCPLHPLSISRVQEGNLMYACNFLL